MMRNGINYLFSKPEIRGEKCPTCKNKSWEIFKCNKCGAIFCKHCRSDLIQRDDDSIDVNCDCGEIACFIDI